MGRRSRSIAERRLAPAKQQEFVQETLTPVHLFPSEVLRGAFDREYGSPTHVTEPFTKEEERFIGYLKKALRPEHTILSLGAGTADLEEKVALTTGAAVTGVDFSKVAVDQARSRIAERDIPNLTVVHADMVNYQIQGEYSGIISILAMHWIRPERRAAVMQRMMAHTAQGGFNFLLVVASAQYSSTDFRIKTDRLYSSAGWKTVHFQNRYEGGGHLITFFAHNETAIQQADMPDVPRP